MLLSLDISTSCTGYCIFDNNNELKEMNYINLSKHKDFYSKAKEVKRVMLELKSNYEIKYIAVEENLQAFRPGLSSAKTLMTLAQFNGTVRWICFEVFGVQSTPINVNTARKSVNLKIDKKDKSKTTKEKVLEWVINEMPAYIWPTKVLKSGRNKGQVRRLDACYDMADAYVIGRAYFVI
jgi:Holliday junction resolvasome RuvABC endonuclease subunit